MDPTWKDVMEGLPFFGAVVQRLNHDEERPAWVERVITAVIVAGVTIGVQWLSGVPSLTSKVDSLAQKVDVVSKDIADARADIRYWSGQITQIKIDQIQSDEQQKARLRVLEENGKTHR